MSWLLKLDGIRQNSAGGENTGPAGPKAKAI
jgi:hypothetical protein